MVQKDRRHSLLMNPLMYSPVTGGGVFFALNVNIIFIDFAISMKCDPITENWTLFFNFCTLKFLLYSNIELLALFSLLSVFKTWMSWNLYGVVSKRFPTTCQSVVRGTWASIDALLTNFLGLHTNISHIWLISSNTRGHPDPFALHRHPSLKFLCQFKSAFQLAHLYWIFLKMHFAHSCLTVIEHILIHKMPLHFYGTSFFTWKQKKNKNSFDTFW